MSSSRSSLAHGRPNETDSYCVREALAVVIINSSSFSLSPLGATFLANRRLLVLIPLVGRDLSVLSFEPLSIGPTISEALALRWACYGSRGKKTRVVRSRNSGSEILKLQSVSWGNTQKLRSLFPAPKRRATRPPWRVRLQLHLARHGVTFRDRRTRVCTAKCSQFLPQWPGMGVSLAGVLRRRLREARQVFGEGVGTADDVGLGVGRGSR